MNSSLFFTLSRLAGTTLERAMSLVAVLTPGCIVYLGAVGALGEAKAAVVAVVVVLASLAGARWLAGCSFSGLLQSLARLAERPFRNAEFASLLVIGLLLRIGFSVIYMAPPQSDGAVYLSLADLFLRDAPYQDPRGDLAYWPPGYPMILAGFLAVLGKVSWILVISNCVFFILTALAVRSLALQLAGGLTARIAVTVVALWPNLILTTTGGAKELPALLFLTVSCVLFLQASRKQGPAPLAGIAAGIALGAASLIQPSFMLLPAAYAAHLLVQRARLMPAVVLLLSIALGMALAIAPWSLRNVAVLHKFVPIATNGGEVFYRANNPLATGGYIDRGEVDLFVYPEVERSALGFALGKQWIRENPGDFARLAGTKMALFQGDDAYGAYWCLKRALGIEGLHYAGYKVVSNLYWLLLWLTLLVLMLRRPAGERLSLGLSLLNLIYLYFFVIDSIFESGSRHHIPLAGVVAVLVGALLEAEACKKVRPEAQVRLMDVVQ
ncbi:MAG: glycosyltransferase family 39 protein [Proteobacteria bacterium]|nr:glycosyltransferase family 39 protein [Pseudomonadota bacterium]